jgi:hypothetical protein
LEQLLKLLFFDPVVSRRDSYNNGYCHEYGGTFHPAGFPAVLDYPDRQGAGGCEEKDTQDVILEILYNQFPQGLDLS